MCLRLCTDTMTRAGVGVEREEAHAQSKGENRTVAQDAGLLLHLALVSST